LRKALRALGSDVAGSLRDLAPILLVIAFFQFVVLRQPLDGLLPLAGGGVLVVIGLTLFVFGLKLALFPIGETLAFELAAKGSIFWLLSFAFALGLGTTIAEPALIAVTEEAAEMAAEANMIGTSAEEQERYAFGLRLAVAVSVGVALVLGVLRIVIGWSLVKMILGGYLVVVSLTAVAPREIIAIAYDSGGVTTSTVTVPLVAALGVGLASALSNRNPMTDGFGLIALASLTPMMFVMCYGMVIAWT